MNPNENNPTSPSGATGGVTPSPVDFTNPSNLNTNTSSLSMSDSLSSAQDDLTSAGQAATTDTSGATSLSDGAASMTPPMQTLKPADPVPGSIGSVTSVPAAKPEPVDTSALSGDGMASTATGAGSSAGGSADNAATGAASAPAAGAAAEPSSKPVQPYYNPFMRNSMPGSNGMNSMAGAGQTSSTNVPPALQPQTEKFSDKLKMPKEKKGSTMALLGWLMAVVFAVAAVIFAILWVNAKNNPEIIYRDKPVAQEPDAKTGTMVCRQDLGGEAIEGVEGLIDRQREMTAKFDDEGLTTIGIVNTLNFVDNAAAEGSRWYFDDLNNWYGEIAGNLGIEAIDTDLVIEDNTLKYSTTGDREDLMGDYLNVFMLTGNEDGSVNTSVEDVKGAYESAGFRCSVAE